MAFGKQAYIPVPRLECAKNSYKGYNLNWWKDPTILRHNGMLVSAYYGTENKYGLGKNDLRHYLDIPEDQYIMADSGGWQMASLGTHMDAKQVVQWAEKNRCDTLLALDYIPEKVTQSKDLIRQPMHFFDECVERTKKSCETFERERNDIELLNILHGDDGERVQRWWDGLKDWQFDGWGFGTTTGSNPMEVAMHLSFLLDKGVKVVHGLGLSGWSTVPVLIYALRYFDRVTYDSQSWVQRGVWRNWTIPFQIASCIRFGEVNPEVDKLDAVPCDCPACNLGSLDLFHKETKNYIANVLLGFHHLYWLQRVTYFLEHYSRMEDAYLRILDPQQQKACEWLRETAEGRTDWQVLYRRYLHGSTHDLSKWW